VQANGKPSNQGKQRRNLKPLRGVARQAAAIKKTVTKIIDLMNTLYGRLPVGTCEYALAVRSTAVNKGTALMIANSPLLQVCC
jgi:hypothetical protein